MSYLLHLATFFGIYAILGVSLNLLIGYTGLVWIAHAATFAVGAYAGALFATKLALNFFLAMLLAMLVAGILGSLTGWIFSRLGGDYYMLASVSWNYIVVSVLINWESLTNGPLGISGIPKPSLGELSFAEPTKFFLLTLVLLGIVYAAARFITNSSFGRVIKAIREDEQAAKVFGYNTLMYKVAISGMGAAMAGIAGVLLASYIGFVDPSSFDVMESIFILAIVVVGGFANIRGSLVGALALVLLPELLRFAGFPAEIAAHVRLGLYGLALILFMLYRPQGIIGEYKF
ncbi:MAG: branched-chain amino acid ABC transporter permease [Candidatus Liptonbacteria bacterium]|nr:branched-chain amino acid ABC transporter permease [Candidatus Liptonbacteria bacterium]